MHLVFFLAVFPLMLFFNQSGTDGCNCFGQRQCAGIRPVTDERPIKNETLHMPSRLRCFSCSGGVGQCSVSKLITCPRESQYCKLDSNAITGLVSQSCARRIHCPSTSFRGAIFDSAKDIVTCW